MTVHHTPGHLCLQPTGPTRQRHSLAGACATALLALAAIFSAGAAQAAACTSTTVLYAAPASAGAANGSNWANATTLQGALAVANGNPNAGRCFEIRVKQGVYKPTATTDRSISFAITRPLQLKGGYTGNTSAPDERVLNARNTVLSGDIDNNDTGASTNGGITANASDIQGSNSYHVLTVGGPGDTSSVGGPYTADATDASFTLVEGFSVTGGRANGSSPHYAGGGLYCNGRGSSSGPGCSPSISNATFSGNSANYYGGAIYNNGSSGTSSPTISNATFSGNLAYNGSGGAIYNNGSYGTSSPTISNATFSGNSAYYGGGGAIYNYGSSGTSSPTISNATFSGNSASGGGSGGAIYNYGSSGTSSPTISNATFSGNSASGSGSGGAIYNVGTSGISSPTISNATFSGNSASGSGGGGAIYNNGSSGTISNATFSGNSAYYGGAIYIYGGSGTITASILWGNTLTGGAGAGPQIFNPSATTTVQSSIVQGGWTGAGNLNADPVLGPLQDNGGPTFTMVPGAGGAAIDAVACNVSGTTVTADQRGVARPQGATCDMGAVERRTSTNALGITFAGTGAGSVTGGLGACASTSSSCSATYGDGDPLTVTLVATPTTGSSFTGWGGACSGTASCVVTMDAARSVTANFALNAYAITTTANPAAGGSVACTPNPVNHGSTATCTPTAQPGYMFTGWGGDCSGAAAVCSLANVTANKAVTANFAVVQTSFSGTTVPSAGGTAGPATASFTGGGATCRFDDNASTAFVAAPTTLPAGQTMPHGMLQFKLVGCDATPVTMSITWPAAVQGLSKWGKATAGAASTHFAPNGLNVIGNTTSFTVQDGQKGDDDWAVNGEIVDPVGATVPVAAAAINATPVPTLGQWALVLLSLMAAALGMGTLRRRVGNHS